MTVTGACLCGAVRFEADRPPRRITHCHCSMCRRATGDPHAFPAGFHDHRREKIAWLCVDEHLPDAPP